jgi:hypothetical protein
MLSARSLLPAPSLYPMVVSARLGGLSAASGLLPSDDTCTAACDTNRSQSMTVSAEPTSREPGGKRGRPAGSVRTAPPLGTSNTVSSARRPKVRLISIHEPGSGLNSVYCVGLPSVAPVRRRVRPMAGTTTPRHLWRRSAFEQPHKGLVPRVGGSPKTKLTSPRRGRRALRATGAE